MNKPKLLSTHVLYEAPRQRLAEHFDVEYWTGNRRPSREEMLQRAAGKDALICLLTERVDQELLDAAGPNLRIIANVAVGFDNVDVPACTSRNVAVTNTPGVLDETTADFAWALLMAVARRVVEGDRLARSGPGRNGISTCFVEPISGARRWGSSDLDASAVPWRGVPPDFGCA